ncbi:enterochelin esterase [Massilia sp. DJPM01]|uniref:enterochelin esterase n=1 Tax=Massilia sp. DJPM01 TaxID=3024404 RepID=UPI00259E9DCF|nr:enterochelin esterase [Massilia sp. DJPM01]MDM5180799.1 enterochelin esterase [Massilia sp. DJPM01]
MTLSFLFTGALAALLISHSAIAADTSPLPRFSGTLRAQQSRAYPVRLAEGDYVQGTLSGPGMRLVLLDAGGKRAQVLAKGQRDEQEFMFVAGARGPYTLDVRAPRSGTYQLQLLQVVPRAAQRAAQPEIASVRLQALQQALAAGGDSGAFWREVEQAGAPLVEMSGENQSQPLVTFLWRGARQNVRILGGPSSDHDEMQRLGRSDVWFRSYRVPPGTRLSYRLAPDVPELDAPAMVRRRAILATAQRDPLNRRSFPEQPLDNFDGASVLELPGATPQAWVAPRPGVTPGSVEKLRLSSSALGNTRDIYLYRPHGYQAGAAGNALAVLFDAETYLSEVPSATILDNLVAAAALPPTAAILIANPSNATRSAELPPNPAFARFLAEELMPWARQRGIWATADQTVIAGASYGGLAAAYAGLRHPELFGKVYSQSGSFWWSPDGQGQESEAEWLTRRFIDAPAKPVEFLLEAGLFESGRNGAAGILDSNRHLRDVLRAKGYRVTHHEFASGHDYYHWRGSLAAGLVALIGKRDGK